jgi:TetR/AcrR family transcriptional repressor of nem operon
MTEVVTAILNAAERRMRLGGFSGFSFREIAADVGMKSSSIHYHFPTKEDLAAAVIRRYTADVSRRMDIALAKDNDPVRVWTETFRGKWISQGKMCPCTMLAAASLDLPEKVVTEVRKFFQMSLDKLVSAGLSEASAAEFYSTLIGATVVATALKEPAVFERAIGEFQEMHAVA